MSADSTDLAHPRSKTDSHAQLLRDTILGDESFVEAVFQGSRPGETPPWTRVIIRPILLKNGRRLQFSYFDETRDITRNFRDTEAVERVDELLAWPFRSMLATTTGESIRVQFSRKGRPIVHRERLAEGSVPLDLAHDRTKAGILSDDRPIPFLQAVGVMTADGQVRADQRRKFRQINEFLRLIDETGEVDRLESRPVHVVDLGCGSAALTFATYHYLNTVRNIPATLVGVDAKTHLMERHEKTAASLGWRDMSFHAARIIEYKPEVTPDIVLALHACDTATDEALAQAIRWQSKLIFSAPCCHHHLQAQLASADTPDPFHPVLRHGILRERLGDILTDSFRAHILRLMGYRTEVFEFIPIEHTPKNLMIRAIFTGAAASPALVNEYLALKAYWGVTPYLETLLEEPLASILAVSPR